MNILCTPIGFLMSMYMSIGNLSGVMQPVMRCFPTMRTAAMIRHIMMCLWPWRTYLDIYLKVGDTLLTPGIHVLVLVGTALLFFALSVWLVSRPRRTNFFVLPVSRMHFTCIIKE